MINLLPPEERKLVSKDYKIRLATAYILLMSIAFLIGVVLLLPSYFVVDTQANIAEAELESLQNSTESAEREVIKEELTLTGEYLRELTKNEVRTPINTLLSNLSTHANGEIEITNMAYGRGTENEGTSRITLGGVAPTRDALLNFKVALESDEFFEEVKLPVSSLANDVDIEFNIELNGPF